MQRLKFIFGLWVLAIVGCSSNEAHTFLVRPHGGEDASASGLEIGKPIPAWQEGMIGLYKAICTYKEEKGKFSAYAYACIKANILDAVKAASREKNRPLNNYVPLENTELVSSDDLTDDIGDRQLMERIRAGLNGEEEKIFELWAEGCSYAEIAEEIKKSVKYVDNALQRIRRKAKKILSGREDI